MHHYTYLITFPDGIQYVGIPIKRGPLKGWIFGNL